MSLRVLVVDADPAAAARATELSKRGYRVVRVADLSSAAEVLMREPIDSIVCSEELRAEVERAYAEHLPVVPASGESAALLARTLARLARRSISPTVQLSIASQLDAALAEAALGLEPVVDLRDGAVRVHRGGLVAPGAPYARLIEMAQSVGRVLELRRAERALARDAIARREVARVMLDCTLEDLLDPQLYDTAGAIARATLLVVSERDVLALDPDDARDRLRSLRVAGFGLVARVGTDIAGLTNVGVVRPSYALLELSAFGDVGPVLTRVVAAIVAACRHEHVAVIADVATSEHAECARETGCMLAVGAGISPEPSIEA